MGEEFTGLNSKFLFDKKFTITCAKGEQYALQRAVKKSLNIDQFPLRSVNFDSSFYFDLPDSHVEAMLSDRILKALEMFGGKIGIGNMGFLPHHSSAATLNLSQEIVMLIDLDNEIKLTQSVTSTVPSYHNSVINNIRDLVAFADMINFPSQGIVLKQIMNGLAKNLKSGILTWDLLYTTVLQFNRIDTELVAETDMRSYLNPTRMNLVEHANAIVWQKYKFLLPSTIGNRNST